MVARRVLATALPVTASKLPVFWSTAAKFSTVSARISPKTRSVFSGRKMDVAHTLCVGVVYSAHTHCHGVILFPHSCSPYSLHLSFPCRF